MVAYRYATQKYYKSKFFWEIGLEFFYMTKKTIIKLFVNNMSNKNEMHHLSKTQSIRATFFVGKEQPINTNLTAIFDIYSIFNRPQPHPLRRNSHQNTRRHTSKLIKNFSTLTPPQTKRNLIPQIKMRAVPQTINSQSLQKTRAIKFNFPEKIHSIHSQRNNRTRKSSQKIQSTQSSKLLHSETKQKLRQTIIQGFGVINILQCSTLDLGELQFSKKLVVDGKKTQNLHHTLVKKYSQRPRLSSKFTRKVTLSRQQDLMTQSKLVGPWSPTFKDKNGHDIDLAGF